MKVIFYARGPLVEYFKGVGARLQSKGNEVRYLCDEISGPAAGDWRSVTSEVEGPLTNFRDLCNTFPTENLWRGLFLERHACFYPSFLSKRAPDWERWLAYAVCVANNLDKAFREERPDYFFSEIAVGTSNYLAFLYCRKYGCEHVSMFSSRIGEEIIFCPGLDDEYPQGFEQEYLTLQKEEDNDSLRRADAYIAKMRSKPESPVYMLTNGEAFSILNKRKIKTVLGILRRGRRNSRVLNQLTTRELLKYNVLRWRNTRWLRQHIWDAVPTDYFYYPLQYEPEAATLLMGNDFSNQLSIIERIARNLPGDCLLVVKEHYAQPGSRDWRFYGKLSYFPNVRVVSPWMNSIDLIKGSRAVVTVNSTVGWEAILMKKPVYLMGKAVFRVFPYIVHLEDEPDWFVAFSKVEALAARTGEAQYDKTLRSLVAAYLEKCHPGNFIPGSAGFLTAANLEAVASSIHKFIR